MMDVLTETRPPGAFLFVGTRYLSQLLLVLVVRVFGVVSFRYCAGVVWADGCEVGCSDPVLHSGVIPEVVALRMKSGRKEKTENQEAESLREA